MSSKCGGQCCNCGVMPHDIDAGLKGKNLSFLSIQRQTGRRPEAPKLFSNHIIFNGEVNISSKQTRNSQIDNKSGNINYFDSCC